MDPMQLQALIAMLRGGGGMGAGGPGFGAAPGPMIHSPPADQMMPSQPGIQTPQPASIGGAPQGMPPGVAGTFAGPSAPAVGDTTRNDFGPRSSPPQMPTPAPGEQRGFANQPPVGAGGGLGGGAAEPTESGGRPPQQALPPIPRNPLGALLMPQSFPGGGIPGAGGGMPQAGAGGFPPSNPWAMNPLMASFLNRTPTGGIGG